MCCEDGSLPVVEIKRNNKIKRRIAVSKKELRLLLPDGSLKDVVERLLADAGIPVSYQSSRSFRGTLRGDYIAELVSVVVYQIRPWDMGPVVKDGFAHLGIAASDMLWNSGCVEDRDVIVLDHYPLARAGGSKTRLVVAVSEQSSATNITDLRGCKLATEYVEGTTRWLAEQGITDIEVLGCHGKLEAFKDLGVGAIVDNVETGDSLKANGWQIIHEVIESQTCLFANPQALYDPVLKPVIQSIQLLLKAVIDARCRTMVMCNVDNDDNLKAVDELLQESIGPSQRPTVSALVGGGHAVEALVMIYDLPKLLNELKRCGATTIVTLPCKHFIP